MLLEWLSALYLRSRLLGEPRLLAAEEIDLVGRKLIRRGAPADRLGRAVQRLERTRLAERVLAPEQQLARSPRIASLRFSSSSR